MLKLEKSFSLKPKRPRKLLLRPPLKTDSPKKPHLMRKKWRDLDPNNKLEKSKEKSKKLSLPLRKPKPRLKLIQRPRPPDKRKRKPDSPLKLKRDLLRPKECKPPWSKLSLMPSRPNKKLLRRKRSKKKEEEPGMRRREPLERLRNSPKSKERRPRLLLPK